MKMGEPPVKHEKAQVLEDKTHQTEHNSENNMQNNGKKKTNVRINGVCENKDNKEKKESGNFLKCNLMKKNPFIICEWLHQADYKVTKNSKQQKLKLSSFYRKHFF